MGGEVVDRGAVTMEAALTPEVSGATLVVVKDGRDVKTTRANSMYAGPSSRRGGRDVPG